MISHPWLHFKWARKTAPKSHKRLSSHVQPNQFGHSSREFSRKGGRGSLIKIMKRLLFFYLHAGMLYDGGGGKKIQEKEEEEEGREGASSLVLRSRKEGGEPQSERGFRSGQI